MEDNIAMCISLTKTNSCDWRRGRTAATISQEEAERRQSLIELKDRGTDDDTAEDDPDRAPVACRHVTDARWEELCTKTLEPFINSSNLAGLVLVNPKFARIKYVPSAAFRVNFDDVIEYGTLTLEAMIAMNAISKDSDFERLMQSIIRSDAVYVAQHVCRPVQALDKLVLATDLASSLTRLSVHYYYLDEHFVRYLARHFGERLVVLDLANSIGLTPRACSRLAAKLPALAHLNLAGCDISERALGGLLENVCPQLESLDLSDNCAITGRCLTRGPGGGTVKCLKRLNLRDCWGVTPAALLEMVLALAPMPRLSELVVNAGINDQSLEALTTACLNLQHLDITFEEFTHCDWSGLNVLTDRGFAAIGKLRALAYLKLAHVGLLTNAALNAILAGCSQLSELTLNLRHRHHLTDRGALKNIARHCPNLRYFEAVHSHFIARHTVNELSKATSSLQQLILRGDELVEDEPIAELISQCSALRLVILDGCRKVGEKTFTACVLAARDIPFEGGIKETFEASLIATSVDRTTISELATQLPDNLRIRASDQERNKQHYSDFNGQTVQSKKLHDTFAPFYFRDFY